MSKKGTAFLNRAVPYKKSACIKAQKNIFFCWQMKQIIVFCKLFLPDSFEVRPFFLHKKKLRTDRSFFFNLLLIYVDSQIFLIGQNST